MKDTVDEEAKEAVDQEGGSEADLGPKLDYLFGKGTGRKHNIERSKAMKVELSKIEIRTYTAKELPGTPVVEYTATTRESLLMGPGGALEVGSVWINDRSITVILKGGQ